MKAQCNSDLIEAAYGTVAAPTKPHSDFIVQRRMNFQAAIVSMLLPTLIFAAISAVVSFPVHFYSPGWTFIVVALCTLIIVVFGFLWYRRSKLGGLKGPTWHGFLLMTMILAYALGMIFGYTAYWNLVLPKAELDSLVSYRDVDPEMWRGEQLMDAGIATFTRDAHLDMLHAAGIKSPNQYCVVPIIRANQSLRHDFWAVGVNCCSGNRGDFHCGDWSDPTAHAGLRLMREDHRAFMRLAVQQAEALYGIRAEHPIFFYWMTDPAGELRQFQRRSVRSFFLALAAYVFMQAVLVAGAMMMFSFLAAP